MAPSATAALAAPTASAALAAPAALAALTAIVAPLAAELAGVLAATRERREVRVPVVRADRPGSRPRYATVTLGRLAGAPVALMATGDGPGAASAGLAALLAAVRPRRLLVIGVAGGLTPGLVEGTLVAARRVRAVESSAALADPDAAGLAAPASGGAALADPDAAWLAAALAGGAVAGTVVTADRILASPAARQAVLHAALPGSARPVPARPAPELPMPALPRPIGAAPGAASAPIATVDLESAAYARIAAAWPLPYLVVRAVLDPAEEELPLDFEACRGRDGRVANARVVWRALARPRCLPRLWRLRARVHAAATRLAALAERLVVTPANGAPVHQGQQTLQSHQSQRSPQGHQGQQSLQGHQGQRSHQGQQGHQSHQSHESPDGQKGRESPESQHSRESHQSRENHQSHESPVGQQSRESHRSREHHQNHQSRESYQSHESRVDRERREDREAKRSQREAPRVAAAARAVAMTPPSRRPGAGAGADMAAAAAGRRRG